MPIQIQRAILSNGLRVIVHEDHTTPLAACNIAYNVGSRDEDPEHTGMAHLMEHLMFCGSVHIPDYDGELQKAGAINNAYTSQDLTHYYVLLPANSIETALWLESDRMLAPAFRQASLDIQKNVVIEEFKETCLNRPYGDMPMLLNAMAYRRHPYQWLPVGKKVEHIAGITMPMMKDFHARYYCPNNAVLVIAGNVHFDSVMPVVEKWFDDIPSGNIPERHYAPEPPQMKARYRTVNRKVPSDMLIKCWPMCHRLHPDYYACDLLSDLLGTGQSSRLYQKFVVETPVFTDISAYITGTADNGIFIVGGRPAEKTSIEMADAALSNYIYRDFFDDRLKHDLQKVKNQAESILLNNTIKIEDRASIIAVGEVLGDVKYFMDERTHYFSVTEEQIMRVTQTVLQEKHCNTLYYKHTDVARDEFVKS